MEILEACRQYWQDSDGRSGIESVEFLNVYTNEEVTVRITWPEEVSDWKLYLDESGVVLDAYHIQTVVEY